MNNLLSLTYKETERGQGGKDQKSDFSEYRYKFHLVTTFYVIVKQKGVSEKSEMTKKI